MGDIDFACEDNFTQTEEKGQNVTYVKDLGKRQINIVNNEYCDVKCMVSMINYVSGSIVKILNTKETDPVNTSKHKKKRSKTNVKSKTTGDDAINYHCYWCRHPTTTFQIGCPIKYIGKSMVKVFTSKNDTTYIIKQTLPDKYPEFVPQTDEEDPNTEYNLLKDGYYISDGMFCSFECCKSYIKDNSTDVKYEYSDMLLNKLFKDITGNTNEIIPAPHWRCLKVYGGWLDIETFRENPHYEHITETLKMPTMYPYINLYEYKLKV